MPGEQTAEERSIESLINITDEAQAALIGALPEGSEAPHTLRLHFQGYG
jgi:hypothetical protein